MDWFEDFKKIVDKPGSIQYSRIRNLKKDQFQGSIKINFHQGIVNNVNFNCTLHK